MHVQIPEEMVKHVVDILVKVVESEGSTLASIAMESIGHIGLRCALPSISRNSSTGKTCVFTLQLCVNCAIHHLSLLIYLFKVILFVLQLQF